MEYKSDENLLKVFNGYILSQYDMAKEEYDFERNQEKYKNIQLLQNNKRIQEEVSQLFLFNQNLVGLTYFKKKGKKKKLVTIKSKQGYEIMKTVQNVQRDTLYYQKALVNYLGIFKLKQKYVFDAHAFLQKQFQKIQLTHL